MGDTVGVIVGVGEDVGLGLDDTDTPIQVGDGRGVYEGSGSRFEFEETGRIRGREAGFTKNTIANTAKEPATNKILRILLRFS